MRINIKYLLLLVLLLLGIIYLFPYLFSQLIDWQREFNQLISSYLHQIKENSWKFGSLLIFISFAYGVLHALGPGHGKFVIASYLSTHHSRVKTSMRLTFLSSLMQALVAIIATSIVVVGLQLSSRYFQLSQLWLERTAYSLVLVMALLWIYQGIKSGINHYKLQKQSFKIHSIAPISVNSLSIQKSAVINNQKNHIHNENCGCGHQHLPNAQQLENISSFKSQFLVILSIGMRPCSGAIFILFLSYMLDLYWWGIWSTLAMGVGTSITLTGFALMVLYARRSAEKVGAFYFSYTRKQQLSYILKSMAGFILLFFAIAFLYGTTLPVTGGAVLFTR